MKLAEALALRADLQKRIAVLKGRINENATVEEGDKPAEDPTELLDEALVLSDTLRGVTVDINEANMKAMVDGLPMMHALAQRDHLDRSVKALQEAGNETRMHRMARYGRNEIKQVSMLDRKNLNERADALAKARRDLDVAIQQVNWTYEI